MPRCKDYQASIVKDKESAKVLKLPSKGKGKGKGRPPKAAAVVDPDLDSEDTIDHDDEVPDADALASDGHASDASSISGRATSASQSKKARIGTPLEDISMETMTKIANFFEGHPMYYDLADSHYKNTQLRDMKLVEFGQDIGLSGEYFYHVKLV